jgi:hypothetical protein
MNKNNIINKFIHNIKINECLYLYNYVFPYPPFTTYKWEIRDKNIIVTSERESGICIKEGGSLSDFIEFKFIEKGEYTVNINKINSYNDDKEEYNVKVSVS